MGVIVNLETKFIKIATLVAIFYDFVCQFWNIGIIRMDKLI